MNTHDRIDQLLAHSAPTPVGVNGELERTLDVMAHDARAQVAAEAPPTRRAPRLVAGIGLTVLLTSGAGAAAASGGFEWLPWAQDPDAVYTFTLPSGRECEIRGAVTQTEEVGDWNGFVENVGRLSVDNAAVERWATHIQNDPEADIWVWDDAGNWHDPGPGATYSNEDLYTAAHWVAMGDAIAEVAADAGVVHGFGGDQQLRCEVVAP